MKSVGRLQSNTVNSSESAAKIKGYQTRIAALENQIKQAGSELQGLKKLNTEIERELSQKRGSGSELGALTDAERSTAA
jgi:chromosome segregation ATPase